MKYLNYKMGIDTITLMRTFYKVSYITIFKIAVLNLIQFRIPSDERFGNYYLYKNDYNRNEIKQIYKYLRLDRKKSKETTCIALNAYVNVWESWDRVNGNNNNNILYNIIINKDNNTIMFNMKNTNDMVMTAIEYNRTNTLKYKVTRSTHGNWV